MSKSSAYTTPGRTKQAPQILAATARLPYALAARSAAAGMTAPNEMLNICRTLKEPTHAGLAALDLNASSDLVYQKS